MMPLSFTRGVNYASIVAKWKYNVYNSFQRRIWQV